MAAYGRRPSYSHYRGRRTSRSRSVLKGIIAVLVVLVIAAGGLLLYLQDNLVYGDDGVHLVLPWGDSTAADPAPSTPASPPTLITDAPEESSQPVEEDQPLHAVSVTQTELLAGSAQQQAESTGANAVVVTMKNDDGTLNYVSDVQLAVDSGASGSDPTANEAIQALTAGEVYTIAQVSCFRDHNLPGYDSSLALHTNSGYRWTDNQDVRWTCPANETVQTYLIDLCTELAELGFDEILLTNCGYPTADTGTLGWIKVGDAYPKGSLDTILTPFLAQLAAALEPYGTKLSVRSIGSELAGETADTGLTLSGVLASCDHFWLDADDAAAYANFAGAPEDPSEKLVSIVSTPGEADQAWAVLY